MPLLLLLRRLNKVEALSILVMLLVVAIVALGLYVDRLRGELAAKPRVEVHEHVVERKVQVKVAGPVRIEEHIVEGPGQERVIERVVYREAVKTDTETGREATVLTVAEPCSASAPARRWRHAVLDFSPGSGYAPVGLHGGVTLWDTLILEAGGRWGGPGGGLDRLSAGAGVRF